MRGIFFYRNVTRCFNGPADWQSYAEDNFAKPCALLCLLGGLKTFEELEF